MILILRVYTIMLYLIQPLVWIYLWLRGKKILTYRKRWAERYGFCIDKVKPYGIVLHSVSVGETLTAIPLVNAIRYHYPNLPITVTTMTPTGSERAKSVFGKDVYHVYLPYDLPSAINRFLNTVKPRLVIIMETEIWPNIIRILYQNYIPLVIANARLSKHSTKAYKILGSFMKDTLQYITLIAAQSTEDGDRFLSLGVKHSHLAIIGNLKFDISVKSELMIKTSILRNKWAPDRPVWIAASTHDYEELIVLNVHRILLQKFPNLLLILVPRHPERFKYIYNLVNKHKFTFILRSSKEVPTLNTQVVIGDTMGELMLLYGISDLAFVGGSLVKCGGHNPLEPAACSIPILVGPYIWNFKEVCDKLIQGKGLIMVTDETSLEKEVSNLLMNDNYRQSYGKHAIQVLYQNQGALKSLLKLLEPHLPVRTQ